jgi:hypothetical protein
MNPLPAQTPNTVNATENAIPSIPAPAVNEFPPFPHTYLANANRRAATSPLHRSYPWMLAASTAIAGVFCLMYVTKPVLQASQSNNFAPTNAPILPKTEDSSNESIHSSAEPGKVAAVTGNLMPNQDRLPGEKVASPPLVQETSQPRSAPSPVFEQTNLRVQHILNADAPGGYHEKIELKVPVLYQSRNLRWTAAEVIEAREVLARLADYQEKMQNLRAEGTPILESWNRLIERSIPSSELRADSPTIPVNQQDAVNFPRPTGLNTTDLIRIQPAAK